MLSTDPFLCFIFHFSLVPRCSELICGDGVGQLFPHIPDAVLSDEGLQGEVGLNVWEQPEVCRSQIWQIQGM